MIFPLRQHPKEFKKYEEETEIRDIANIKKTEAKKRATLELGIGSSSSSSGLKQPKVNDAFKKLSKYDINGKMQAKFDNAVLELMAINCLPFELVNSTEWKDLTSRQEDNCQRPKNLSKKDEQPSS